jgi:two-component system chemotaxis response regulator CheB
MLKPRVLIVDDSVVIRQFLCDALSRDPYLDIVESAPSTRVALMKIAIARPDFVVLDLEMPEMHGLESVSAILKASPQALVIVLNVPGERGAAVTFDALTLGARDYVTKPNRGVNLEAGLQMLASELAAKIQACWPGNDRATIRDEPILPRSRGLSNAPHWSSSDKRVDVLAIGVSTGGPNALMEVIPRIPKDFPVPILIVQHMPRIFTKLLAERLAAKSQISVAEAISQQRLLPGCAWIAPGDYHMTVLRNEDGIRIATHQGPPENSCRPAVDVLFRSLVQIYGSHVLAVVMTGMGKDGLQGCKQVHAAGGQVLVQDEKTSVVWGMPSFVAKAGLADCILPLQELRTEILNRVWRERSAERALVGER